MGRFSLASVPCPASLFSAWSSIYHGPSQAESRPFSLEMNESNHTQLWDGPGVATCCSERSHQIITGQDAEIFSPSLLSFPPLLSTFLYISLHVISLHVFPSPGNVSHPPAFIGGAVLPYSTFRMTAHFIAYRQTYECRCQAPCGK